MSFAQACKLAKKYDPTLTEAVDKAFGIALALSLIGTFGVATVTPVLGLFSLKNELFKIARYLYKTISEKKDETTKVQRMESAYVFMCYSAFLEVAQGLSYELEETPEIIESQREKYIAHILKQLKNKRMKSSQKQSNTLADIPVPLPQHFESGGSETKQLTEFYQVLTGNLFESVKNSNGWKTMTPSALNKFSQEEKTIPKRSVQRLKDLCFLLSSNSDDFKTWYNQHTQSIIGEQIQDIQREFGKIRSFTQELGEITTNGTFVKRNVWYWDDDQDWLDKFEQKHQGRFRVKRFRDFLKLFDALQKAKPNSPNWPDILLLDLYTPLSVHDDIDQQILNQTNEKLGKFIDRERKLKKYVDRAWISDGVDIANTVRKDYTFEQLPITIYTQRGLVLLEDEWITTLETKGIGWLLKGRFDKETERLMLNQQIYFGKNKVPPKPRILYIDDNKDFQDEFIKRHTDSYDITCIQRPSDVLPRVNKMKSEDKFPHLLLVDLYYPLGDTEENKHMIEVANKKLDAFHRFEKKLKRCMQKTHEPAGMTFIKELRKTLTPAQLPILVYTLGGLLLLDERRIKEIEALNGGWLLKGRYSIKTEQVKIISHIVRSRMWS